MIEVAPPGGQYLTLVDVARQFTRGQPAVSAYHGYPGLIDRLTYRRHNHAFGHRGPDPRLV